MKRASAEYHLTIDELAYIAGFIDGEGCISLHSIRHVRGSRTTVSPRLIIVNTHKGVIDYLAEKLNTTIYARPSCGNAKGTFRMSVQGKKRLIPLLHLLLPYLIVKKLQAELIIEWADGRDESGRFSTRDKWYVEMSHYLNRRGVKSIYTSPET